VALAESCTTGPAPVGCEVSVDSARRADLELFGEGPSRVIVSVEPPRAREFEALMAESAIPWRWIGTTGGARLVIRRGRGEAASVGLGTIDDAWRSGFEHHMA
jgi:phosphoribosylformylglycinamidine (FGAM) synthase-like enzyme